MKRINQLIIIAVVALISSFTANAEFRYGIKAGLNVNKMHFDKNELFDADNKCGWTAGVTTEFTVPIVGIGFDLSVMYTRMNSELENNSSTVKDDNYGKNFLEIPLNLKYKLSIPAAAAFVKPYVFTGPTLAVKLDKNVKDALATKSAQWGWNVGLGVELVKHLQIGAGYTFGINNIVDKVTDYTDAVGKPVDVKLKNNYWTVTAAYMF